MVEAAYTKICPNCKKEIDKYEKVCPMCGQKFQLEYEDREAFYIKDNVGYYLSKFDKMNSKNTKVTWNWASFLFTGLWLIYRKMYNWFAAYFVFIIVETFIAEFLGIPQIVDTAISFVVGLLAGMYGNYLYRQRIEKLAMEGQNMDTEAKRVFADKKGGTNIKPVIVVLVLQIALVTLGVYLLSLLFI